MKFLSIILLLASISSSFAGEPKATICGDAAKNLVKVLAKAEGITPKKTSLELLEMEHDESVYERWVVKIQFESTFKPVGSKKVETLEHAKNYEVEMLNDNALNEDSKCYFKSIQSLVIAG